MDPAIWVCLDMGKKLPCFSSFIVGKMMINKKIWGIANVQTKPFSWDILDVITQFFSWKIMGADPFQISNVQLTLVGWWLAMVGDMCHDQKLGDGHQSMNSRDLHEFTVSCHCVWIAIISWMTIPHSFHVLTVWHIPFGQPEKVFGNLTSPHGNHLRDGSNIDYNMVQ